MLLLEPAGVLRGLRVKPLSINVDQAEEKPRSGAQELSSWLNWDLYRLSPMCSIFFCSPSGELCALPWLLMCSLCSCCCCFFGFFWLHRTKSAVLLWCSIVETQNEHNHRLHLLSLVVVLRLKQIQKAFFCILLLLPFGNIWRPATFFCLRVSPFNESLSWVTSLQIQTWDLTKCFHLK